MRGCARFPFPARELAAGVCRFFAMGEVLAHAFAFEFDPMSVVNDAIEDGVGVGGIADEIVPFLDGRLAREDCGPAAIALLDNFKEVVTSRGVENLQAKIVQDQHLGARQRLGLLLTLSRPRPAPSTYPPVTKEEPEAAGRERSSPAAFIAAFLTNGTSCSFTSSRRQA